MMMMHKSARTANFNVKGERKVLEMEHYQKHFEPLPYGKVHPITPITMQVTTRCRNYALAPHVADILVSLMFG